MTAHFDPADRAYFKAVATWALGSARFDAIDVDPSVASLLVRRLSQLPPESARLVADRAVDPRAQAEPLSDALEPILSDADDETRQRFAAILVGDPTQRAQLLTQFFTPVQRTQVLPSDLPAQRTDAHSTPAHGCSHCDEAGCTGCVRTDWQPGDEGADDMSDDEKLVRARRAGRREADRALRRVLAEESGTVDPDDDEDGTSGTDEDEDDPDATQTRATRRRTRNDSTDHYGGHMSRRDDLQIITSPRSPAEQRAARTRFDHSVDTEVRDSHVHTDAADRELERLLDSDPIPYQEPAAETAARDAARRRANSVGRERRTDAKEISPATFHLGQRRRFHLPDDGGDSGGPAAA